MLGLPVFSRILSIIEMCSSLFGSVLCRIFSIAIVMCFMHNLIGKNMTFRIAFDWSDNHSLSECVQRCYVFFVGIRLVDSPNWHSQFNFSHSPEECVNCVDNLLRFGIALFWNTSQASVECDASHRYKTTENYQLVLFGNLSFPWTSAKPHCLTLKRPLVQLVKKIAW